MESHWCKTGSSADSAELFHAKNELRRELNERVDHLTKEEILSQSEAITRKVLQHERFVQAETVSIYLSYDKEVQTSEILADIFRRGKKCYIPRYFKGKPMEMVRLCSMQDYENLPRNKWNIKQPTKAEEREDLFQVGELDLIILPGLGFTQSGKRLGRGKGYYDEFLVRCATSLKSSPYTMALAFKEQLVPDIPMSNKDVYINDVIFP